MKIIVTGANGFIGRRICEHLRSSNDVFKIARNSLGGEQGFEVDLSDVELVKKRFPSSILEKAEADVIIHCASVLATPENSKDMELFYVNNRITQSVIYLSDQLKAKRVINFSTIGVYPNLDGDYKEDFPVKSSLNSECLYSLSKFCSEELFNYFLVGSNVLNLRLSQTYGSGMRDDRIYSIMLKELKEKNTITVWGNGERVSNFISISYLLQLLDKILMSNHLFGTYNIGEKNMSYLQLGQEIIDKFGNKDSTIIKLDKGVKSKVIINCTKILNDLNRNV